MKQAYFAAALLLAGTPLANAVEFNKDAMKSMQQQGHKIVAESQRTRAYKAADNLCMDIAGQGLVIRPCNDKSATQQWRFDDQGRLVASNGQCIVLHTLQKCGPGKAQQWKYDDSKRLANGNSQCLKTAGNPAKAGMKVVSAACSNASNQVWK